jgi:hypothetical protein
MTHGWGLIEKGRAGRADSAATHRERVPLPLRSLSIF